jgi:hypothetical protein
MNDWDKVSRLGKDAIALGLSPHDSYEWMPMIEGFIHTNDWGLGKSISEEIISKDFNLQKATCNLWNRAINNSSIPAEKNYEVNQILSDLGCGIH